MSDVNSMDHLVRPEKDTLVNGYDNEGFHPHNRDEDGEESASDDERLRVVVTENGHEPPETDTASLPNGHSHEEANGHAVNGSAVVFVDEDMDNHNKACATAQQKPLDNRLHHYVSADDMDRKILNGSDGGTHVSIPEDAVISFSSGRVRVKKGAPSNSPQSPRDRESIPLETMPPSYEGKAGLSGEKAELEAELSNHKNGVWSEGHTYGSAESHFISEKLNGTSKSSDEVSLPVSNHRKCLRGEKLYFTEESRKLCPSWKRLVICGVILIMVAIALLLGVLAATGILLSKSDSKNTRYESGHPLPNMDSIAHAGHSFRPKPSSKVPQKFQPPVTVEAEHFPNATPSATFDVHDTVSQAPPTVTSKVPPLLNDSSHSQTIVPNALVGEFTIIDENFTDDLNDHSSRGYLNLARNLEAELRRIFRDNEGRFDELKILNFRPGSIRVKFVVIWSSDQEIILSDRATEVLSADLRKKNNSFYNFIYVDMNSIHFINVFDECRIQKGGCGFDCVWNYDTLLKTCICPNDMYLLSDGKSCSPMPETSSSLFITSTPSSQKQSSSQTIPVFASTEPTEIRKPSLENESTLLPFPHELTTTPKTTEIYSTDASQISETLKDNVYTTIDLNPTEIPTTYMQTVKGIDSLSTTLGFKESTSSTGGKADIVTETTTAAETNTPLSEDGTIRPQSAFTTESETTFDVATQTEPSAFRGFTENAGTTDTREIVYPNYDTTMYSNPYTYPPQTETAPDNTSTTKSSTLKYHIPEPATELYTWSPPYDYPTEYFNPPTMIESNSTDYPDYTKPDQETFPDTYDGEITGESGLETTAETMTEITSAPSIKREGTWQENQTLPTSFNGSVLGDQAEHTTVTDEAFFPLDSNTGDNLTTTESTMKTEGPITSTNPYTRPTFPFFTPYSNRTPGVRSYDNFTEYYDNSTFGVDKDYSTDITASEMPIETYPSVSNTSSYSWNESSTLYQPITETTYSGSNFTNSAIVNLNSPNASEESPTMVSNDNFSPGSTSQYGFFNLTEAAEPEVTDEAPISTFPAESNMTFPFKAVTDSFPTENPLFDHNGTNVTENGNFSLVEANTETPLYDYTTPTDTESDITETEETPNPTFPTAGTVQFPTFNESHNPNETTLYNVDGMDYTTTESLSPSQDYNTETYQDNFTFPILDDETASAVQSVTTQPVTTIIAKKEMGAESTKHFMTVPESTEPSYPYASGNLTYETETPLTADYETTVSSQESDVTTVEQVETTTAVSLDDVTTQIPFASEFPHNPANGTEYPMKSAKGISEGTPLHDWRESTSYTEITTTIPDDRSPLAASTVPSETTGKEVEVTSNAADFETETITTLSTLLPNRNLYGINSDQTTEVTTEKPSASNTESDQTKGITVYITVPTAESETDYTSPSDETIPTTHSGDPEAVETDATTHSSNLESVETYATTVTPIDQSTTPSFETPLLLNDTTVVTSQPTLIPSAVPLTTESIYNTETEITKENVEYKSFFNSTSNTTLMLSENSNNSSYEENLETTIAYSDITTTQINNGSEQLFPADSNSTLLYLTTPLPNYDNNSTDITGFPYDMEDATTLAPYAYEDATVDSELNFNLTSNMNMTDGNSTDEFSAFYPDNFNSTDNNFTVNYENTNVTTVGYDMLNETTTNASIGIICRDDQFICEPLNLCLNYTFMCDGIKDCPDGIDEADCQGTCHTNFMCSNSSNRCIMSELQCDGIWDCPNGTDEESCKPTECAQHEVMCSDHSKCIRPSDICDLKYDCKDRSDEDLCVERTTCESGGKFYCNDGLCIPWSLKCDGEYDCKEREDEGNCTCLSDEFQCNDGKCLKSSSRCDGHRDCHDGDDEMGCVNVDAQHLVMTYEPYSGTWAMLCAEDWSLDDGHYLCQELGFGHALKTEKLHVSFNGTWMAMRRENLTDSSLWTERVSFVESCTSSLAASVECQKFACGEYSGLLHRRKRELSGVSSSSSSSSQWPFVGYTSTFYSSKGCLSEILTPIWLITSADCLLSISKQPFNGSDWYVRTNIGRSVEVGSVQNHEVLRIISHPHSSKFRSLTVRDYDVALIRLKHALVFVSDKIGAICPPDEQVPPGITCFSGVLDMQTPRAPPPSTLTINSLALQITDRRNCNSVDHYNDLINQRMLCTESSEGHTICDHDEGTPLMCLTGINKWFLAGMLTYQRYCEVYNKHPAVFSNLFSMRKFIDQVTGQKQYEIPHDSNVYMIIPPTTPSPSIPETTTIMYTTTKSLSTLSDFNTTMDDLAYAMTVNGTPYGTEDTTLMENFTESSPTLVESMYADTTLPSDEFAEEEMRGDSNFTTLPPNAIVDGNTTETTYGYPESTYKLRGTYIPDHSEEPIVLNTTIDNTTVHDLTTFSPLNFRNIEKLTDTTIPTTDIVTLDGEIGFNSSELESKMFETTFNGSYTLNKTHDSMMEAQPNETYSEGSFVPYFGPENKTELYAINTTIPVDEEPIVTQPDEFSTVLSTEYTTDYDIYNSSAVPLTRMPVMPIANETLGSIIEPERLTLTTMPGRIAEESSTERTAIDAIAAIMAGTPTNVNSSDTDSDTLITGTPDINYKDAITETESRNLGLTENPLLNNETSTLGMELNKTETTENPFTIEETTTTSDIKETVTELELNMEGRAENFDTPKETIPPDFAEKETTPINFDLKETTLDGFISKEIIPAGFGLKEPTPTDFSVTETTSFMKETFPTDSYLTETTTKFTARSELDKSELIKEATTIDLGLKETETPYLMEGTTTPVSGWSEDTTKSEMKVDGITETYSNLNEETTTLSPESTPSAETRTLMFETEVGTEADISLIAFNDSDGIVLQPVESPDSLSIAENNGSSKDYNMPRSRMLDEPIHSSDILYETTQPDGSHATFRVSNATDTITTELEDHYTTLTTPINIDELQDLITTTETVHEYSIVNTSSSYHLFKESETTPNQQTEQNSTETTPNRQTEQNSTETTPNQQTEETTTETTANQQTEQTTTETTTNQQTEQNSTETTPLIEYDGTLPPELSIAKFRFYVGLNITDKDLNDAELCGKWDHPANETNLNDTKIYYKEWPALGFLQLISEKRMCAATLVSKKFAITSLNCLSVRDNELNPDKWAYIGGLHVDDGVDGLQTHLVSEIIPFTSNSTALLFSENNLALVRIKDNVQINKFSKSVCLPKDVQPDQQCYTAGWGQVPTGVEEGKRFYSVPVRIIPQDECNSTSNYNGMLLDSLICASYETLQIDAAFPTCQMDLGSPLFCLNNDQWELQGVLNFPNPCDMVQPAVYNSISKVQEWIQDILLRNSS